VPSSGRSLPRRRAHDLRKNRYSRFFTDDSRSAAVRPAIPPETGPQ
jgi:hypothetical protein